MISFKRSIAPECMVLTPCQEGKSIALCLRLALQLRCDLRSIFNSQIKLCFHRLTTQHSALASKLKSLFGHLRLARPPSYDNAL